MSPWNVENKRKWTIDARMSYPLSNYLTGSYVTGLPFSKSCRKFGPERKGNRIFLCRSGGKWNV